MPPLNAAQQKALNEFRAFDPNGMAGGSVWGVWDGRTFKVYKSRGPALNSANMRYYGPARWKLYELTPNGWETRAVKDAEDKNNTCDLCLITTVKEEWEDYTQNYYRSGTPWRWERTAPRPRGKIVTPLRLLYLCPSCCTRTGF